MNRALLIGFLAVGLAACGDDGGSESGTDPSSTGTVDPTTGESMTGTPPPTTEPETTTMPATTTGVDESSSGEDTEAGSSSSGAAADSSSTGAPVDFAMTSPAFREGGLFPGTMHIAGGNEQPQLDWVGAPDGTESFGVFFRDVTISFDHSAIWNIPGDADGLPAGVEATAAPSDVPGAVQCQHWFQQDSPQANNAFGPPPRYGYGGPGSDANTYEFILYALDTDDLSGEIDSESDIAAVLAAFEAHAVEQVVLSGQTQGP